MSYVCPNPLVVPADMIHAIVARGWTYHGSNAPTICFFDRPGYWLRLYNYGEWTATVEPETHGLGEWPRVPYAKQPPEFTGRGAIARAKAWGDALIDDNIGWLADLGIKLTSVSVRLFRGSGKGGYVSARTYRVSTREFH